MENHLQKERNIQFYKNHSFDYYKIIVSNYFYNTNIVIILLFITKFVLHYAVNSGLTSTGLSGLWIKRNRENLTVSDATYYIDTTGRLVKALHLRNRGVTFH